VRTVGLNGATGVWEWLQSEAAKRETNASALIVDLVRKEQEGRAA
jgi:hypothetical protein